jgi:hypothetical protein
VKEALNSSDYFRVSIGVNSQEEIGLGKGIPHGLTMIPFFA